MPRCEVSSLYTVIKTLDGSHTHLLLSLPGSSEMAEWRTCTGTVGSSAQVHLGPHRDALLTMLHPPQHRHPFTPNGSHLTKRLSSPGRPVSEAPRCLNFTLKLTMKSGSSLGDEKKDMSSFTDRTNLPNDINSSLACF